MSKTKKRFCTRRIALAVAMALGCSVMGVASAANYTTPITGIIADDTEYADIAVDKNASNNYYTFTEDSTITIDGSTPIEFSSSFSGETFKATTAVTTSPTTSGSKTYIVSNGHKLFIDVTAKGDAVGTGILQTTGSKRLLESVLADETEITVRGDEGNNQKSYGIWTAITNKTVKYPYLVKNDDNVQNMHISITVDNPNGGYGIAVSRPEKMEAVDGTFANNTGVFFGGKRFNDFDIKVSENQNAKDILDESAGLYVDTNNSKISIYGSANLDVEGHGILLTPNSDSASTSNQKISVLTGGKITVHPADNGSERYGIYNRYGSVVYGADAVSGQNELLATPVAYIRNGTQIDGDVYVGDNEKNVVYLGLLGENSYFNGAIKEAGAIKNVAIVLADGAVWNNVAMNKGNIGVDTVVSNIYGINGVLHQTKDSGNVEIQKLNSHLLNIAYDHDVTEPTTILGGDVTIDSAIEGAYVNVFTDYDDNISTEAKQKDVLNALAKKLWYTNYTSGERNLSGIVSIAEGLTSASVSKYYADMSFDELTGQGGLADEAEVLTPSEPTTQTKAQFTNYITADPTEAGPYIEAGVYKNGTYTFTEDTKITLDNSAPDVVPGPWSLQGYLTAVVYSGYNMPKTVIDLGGHSLDLSIATEDRPATGIAASGPSGVIEINNAGAISINSVCDGTMYAAGLCADGGGQIYIHNGGAEQDKKVLKIRGSSNASSNGTAIKTKNGTSGVRSYIKVDGLVDIVADTTDNVGMVEGLSAVASTIDVGGGKIFMSAQGENEGISYGGGATNAAIRAYGEFVSNNPGIVNVNVIKDEDSATGMAIAAGNNPVQINGNFATRGSMGTYGQINVGLNTKDSYWVGNYDTGSGWGVTPGDYGVLTLFMGNQAKWLGDAMFATNLTMDSGASWQGHSENNAVSATIKNGATWYNVNDTTKATEIKSLTGGATEAEAGIVDMTHVSAVDTTIGNYAGHIHVMYKHDVDDPNNILGNNITINHAAEDSAITLITDNSGFDVHQAEQTTSVLTNLAQKLYYNGAIEGAENNLNGYVEIAEGLTASSAGLKLADVSFSDENGQASLLADTIRTPESKIIYGASETAMMKGAKSAMASSALMWRAENNDLMKRMGDLRLDDGEAGIWAKYYGGKYEMDSQNTNLNLKYNAYQVGFDKEVGNNWKVGIAVSHNDGDSSFGNGTADLTATSIGLYGTWNGNDGQYVDLIAKYTRLEDEFDVSNAYGHKLKGDYKTWGTSISAEYGKRFESKSGFYFDPSVELTLGRINSKDYNASSDYLDTWGKNKNMQVQQDAFNTLVGRLGFRLGQKLDNASYFVKLAAAHEFMGEFDSTFRADGEPEGKTSIDFGDTWYEAQIGGSAKLSDNSMLYASFERSFGGDVDEKWRVDAGLRFTF